MVAVGISGATGCIYGIRLLEALRALGQETELILSDWGAETIRLETDLTVEQVKALADRVYDNRNMAAQAASGSSCADAMVIAPCSMKTLAGIAMGYDDSLLVRAADVMLKERRRLILLTRETPLNLSHIRNMETVTLMGGIILPPVPAFYSRPQTVDDIVDQTVSRTLRLLGLDGVILLAFLLGFPANEIVVPCILMGYLAAGSLTEYASLTQLHLSLIHI